MKTRSKSKSVVSNDIPANPTPTFDNGDHKMNKKKKKNVVNYKPISASNSSNTLQFNPEHIVLWRKPLYTMYYFLLESRDLLFKGIELLWINLLSVLTVLSMIFVFFVLYLIPGQHQPFVRYSERLLSWCGYWVGLGILSSVGLGTGLHTFLLYLGPHIAAVTIAAFECNSLDFPVPPYPNDIICPSGIVSSTVVSLWSIFNKVRLESFMWGAGTAIGELPPYFMARAARLSGKSSEETKELEELLEHSNDENASLGIRLKMGVERMVEKMGFFGILVCASVPNPLFDLAGITCGHFLVPFWTFFGATLIGKAIIKMHIQKLFVIIAFSEHHAEKLLSLVMLIPYFGPMIHAPFKSLFISQRSKLHRNPGDTGPVMSVSWLSWIFEKIVLVFIVYFVVSIVNSMAKTYARKKQAKKIA